MNPIDPVKQLDVLDEKRNSDAQLEVAASLPSSWDGVEFDEKDAISARRRVDWILVSTLTLYYFAGFLDRGNIGNARVAGLTADLGMDGNDYNTMLSMFFISYFFSELPVTILLKRVGPHIIMPLLCTLWGVVTMCQGWVQTQGQLNACRFLLGIFEGGLTPCCILIMTCFVRRQNIQLRMGFFFGMIQIAGAFSGLMAYGIQSNLNGAHGYAPWRWIFILEGAGTVALGLVGFIVTPRSPSSAWWLKPRQRAALLAMLANDGAAYVEAKDEKIAFWDACSVVWTNPVSFAVVILTSWSGFFIYSLSYYAAPIVAGLGYTAVRAQLMSVPPFALAACLALSSSYVGDRTRRRTPIIALAGLVGVIGFAINFASSQNAVRYAALFFQVGSTGMQTAAIVSWGTSSVSGHQRRAAHVAIAFSGATAMGCASVWSFKQSEAPRYNTGTSMGMTAAVIILVTPIVGGLVARRANRNRDEKMNELGPHHVYPDAPGGFYDDRDLRWRYTI